MAILEELIEPLSPDEFFDSYLFKQPYAAPFKAERYRGLLSWRVFEEIFASGHGDCWLPKDGRQPEDPHLTTGRLTGAQARAGFAEGRTILVRHAERAHPKIRAIAEDFQRTFEDPVDVQVYGTPGGSRGFDWHYDAEEVFVIQSVGEKEFSLRRNTIEPWPVHSHFPKQFRFDRERPTPEIRCLLREGDWLYIPAGWWHKARAVTDSFHLSVGVMAQTALGHLESLLPMLAQDYLWRQRFPVRTSASKRSPEEQREQIHSLLALLGDSLARTFRSEESVRKLFHDPSEAESVVRDFSVSPARESSVNAAPGAH